MTDKKTQQAIEYVVAGIYSGTESKEIYDNLQSIGYSHQQSKDFYAECLHVIELNKFKIPDTASPLIQIAQYSQILLDYLNDPREKKPVPTKNKEYCAICNSKGHWKNIPADTFQKAIAKGFNPVKLNMSVSNEYTPESWEAFAKAPKIASTAWPICISCLKKLQPYIKISVAKPGKKEKNIKFVLLAVSHPVNQLTASDVASFLSDKLPEYNDSGAKTGWFSTTKKLGPGIIQQAAIESFGKEVSDENKYTYRTISFTIDGGEGRIFVVYQKEKTFKKPVPAKKKLVFEPGTFLDERDGRTYKTVKINNYEWLTENLAYIPEDMSEYKNSIFVGDYTGTQKSIFSKNRFVHDDAIKSKLYKLYGCYYNWETAIECCPSGWSVPNDDDWKKLEEYLGIKKTLLDSKGWRGENIGIKLKSTKDWQFDGNGSDKIGFNILPAGQRNTFSNFIDVSIGAVAEFWTSTECDSKHAWKREFHCGRNDIFRETKSKTQGLSVRCIRKS